MTRPRGLKSQFYRKPSQVSSTGSFQSANCFHFLPCSANPSGGRVTTGVNGLVGLSPLVFQLKKKEINITLGFGICIILFTVNYCG